MELSPGGLAEILESLLSSTRPREISAGWQIICFVLNSSMKEWTYIQREFKGDICNTHITTDYSELNEDEMDKDNDVYDRMHDLECEADCYFGMCSRNVRTTILEKVEFWEFSGRQSRLSC